MASLPSSLRGKSGLPSVRFLGGVKQPDSPSGWISNSGAGHRSCDDGDAAHLFELEEGDVVWSPASYSDLSESHSPSGSVGSSSPMSAASSLSPGGSYRPRHGRRGGRPFTTERFGLSAALAEEPSPLVHQRKTATVLPRTVAVAVPRSGNDGYASGPGRVFGQSAPINVPSWPKKAARMGEDKLGEMDEWGEGREWEEDDGDDGEMVPPHLIVARSHGMSFSVFEGVGRTLKGRDLRRVRNAVFQKTGFLD